MNLRMILNPLFKIDYIIMIIVLFKGLCCLWLTKHGLTQSPQMRPDVSAISIERLETSEQTHFMNPSYRC